VKRIRIQWEMVPSGGEHRHVVPQSGGGVKAARALGDQNEMTAICCGQAGKLEPDPAVCASDEVKVQETDRQ